MNLRYIAYALGTTIASVSLIVACSSSSSSGTTQTGTDSGPKADGATGGGDSSTPTDSGGGNGGGCKLNAGTYNVTTTHMDGTDVDASDAVESAICKDSMSMFDVAADADGGGSLPDGCTASADGCTITCDTTMDMNGSTSTTHSVITIDADGNGETTVTTLKSVADDGGAVAYDCTTTGVAKKQ